MIDGLAASGIAHLYTSEPHLCDIKLLDLVGSTIICRYTTKINVCSSGNYELVSWT